MVVSLDVRSNIAAVTIDNPPANVLSRQVYTELRDLFRELGSREDVKAIILTGSGQKFFSAGADIQDWVELTPDTSDELFELTGQSLDSVYSVPRAVIAAVNGYALAGGMALAAVCDITVASTNATFGLTEINVGVFGGVMHARRWFSETVVRDLALTGRFMTAAEALQRGAIHSVVEPDELLPAAWRLAEMIAEKNLPGIALGKAAANASENLTVGEWKTEFPTYTDLLFNHPEAKEAARAFFERRRRTK